MLIAVVLTSTGSAADKGANNTVNGYQIFILYSVVGLARALLLLFLKFIRVEADLPCAVIRFVGSTAYMLVRMFAGE